MLTSPAFALDGTDAFVSYQRWAFSELGATDPLFVEISGDDGATWTPVEAVADTVSAWEGASVLVSDHVVPTDAVRLRFRIGDSPNDSITEAGLDEIVVETLLCGGSCPADLDADGSVNIDDLLALLGAWATDPGGPPDFDGDGTVAIEDLLTLLGTWGPCP
jgi:hypothetical protein